MRERGNACATSAGTWAFIAQVSDRSPSAPNLRPAMNTMFCAFGSALMAVSSSRSQLSVSMPRASSQAFTPGSLKRATPITRRSGRAAFANPASVGPILPATPSTMMSPSTFRRSSISAWLGRHNSSSNAAMSEMVSGRLSGVSSMFLPWILSLQPNVPDHEQPFEAKDQAVEREPEQGQKHHRHHHGRGVERGLHLNHQVAEPAFGGDELADDGAGDREDGADLHAGKHIRQRTRQLNFSKQRPARAAQRFDEVQQVRLDLAQASRGGEQDREEADAEGDQDVRKDSVAEPDDEQRPQRHLRDHVQGDEQRQCQQAQQRRPAEQHRQRHSDEGAERETAEDFRRGYR